MKHYVKSFAITVVVLFVAVTVWFALIPQTTSETFYPLTTKVVELDRENDVVTCEDFNGFLWEFEGCEDWQEGDIASLLMNSKGTAQIFDDEIVSVRYNGTFEGWN